MWKFQGDQYDYFVIDNRVSDTKGWDIWFHVTLSGCIYLLNSRCYVGHISTVRLATFQVFRAHHFSKGLADSTQNDARASEDSWNSDYPWGVTFILTDFSKYAWSNPHLTLSSFKCLSMLTELKEVHEYFSEEMWSFRQENER